MRVASTRFSRREDPTLAGPRAPFGGDRATYGICPSHRLEVLIGRYVRMLGRRGRP